MTIPNTTGANGIHSLFMANTRASIALAMDLCKAKPAIATIPWGAGPYEGENCLHVLAVNRREKAYCLMLDLTRQAVYRGELTPEARHQWLRAQANGSFFCQHPMELYGGSPLSFAACYGLEIAVTAMLKEEQCDPNSPDWKNEWTGFLPLHGEARNEACTVHAIPAGAY